MPTHAKWARQLTPEERAAELLAYERATTREVRRGYVAAIPGCFFWLAVGLELMGWALHTTDRGSGEIAFYGGLVIGYAGITYTLARFYLRGEKAGWW